MHDDRIPLGGLIPRVLNFSCCCIGNTTASTSSSICWFNPPISPYTSVGFSSTSIALTRLSYSAGRVSSTRYESLLSPIKSPGFNLAGSTSPMMGRKMVWRVDVFMTADLPTLISLRFTLAPVVTIWSDRRTNLLPLHHLQCPYRGFQWRSLKSIKHRWRTVPTK